MSIESFEISGTRNSQVERRIKLLILSAEFPSGAGHDVCEIHENAIHLDGCTGGQAISDGPRIVGALVLAADRRQISRSGTIVGNNAR